MHHYRSSLRQYESLNQNDISRNVPCSLCVAVKEREALAENRTMVVVKNRVPYDLFEFRRTTGEHYMILPRRHVENISDFTDGEKIDMATLAGEFETQGFNVYARSQGNAGRSQPHQHTHLIKLVNKEPKLHIYIAKPYFIAHID